MGYFSSQPVIGKISHLVKLFCVRSSKFNQMGYSSSQPVTGKVSHLVKLFCVWRAEAHADPHKTLGAHAPQGPHESLGGQGPASLKFNRLWDISPANRL